MASVFGHAVAAFGLGSFFPKGKMIPKVYLLGVVSTIIPDLDVISTYFGIWGTDMLGHRGITHSIAFGLAWAFVFAAVFHRDQKKGMFIFYYFVCIVSHGALDGLTNGGDGIGYFAPFSNYRTHLPFQIIQVSPLGVGAFFSEWGTRVIMSEAVWIGIPSFVFIIVNALIRRAK